MATHTPSKGWGPPALGPKPLPKKPEIHCLKAPYFQTAPKLCKIIKSSEKIAFKIFPDLNVRTRDHVIAVAFYSQMLYQLSYSRLVGCVPLVRYGDGKGIIYSISHMHMFVLFALSGMRLARDFGADLVLRFRSAPLELLSRAGPEPALGHT